LIVITLVVENSAYRRVPSGRTIGIGAERPPPVARRRRYESTAFSW
jgi:hypothetical protein